MNSIQPKPTYMATTELKSNYDTNFATGEVHHAQPNISPRSGSLKKE